MLIRKSVWVGEPEVHGFGPVKGKGGRRLGSDTECTGLNPWGTYGVDRKVWPARPFFFSFCDPDGNRSWARLPVNARTREVRLVKEVREALESYLADPTIDKVFHNAPYDTRLIRALGLRIEGRVHCTQIGMHAIRPDEPTFKLKPLCKKYLSMPDDDEKALKASVVAARRRAKAKGWAIAEAPEADYWLADPKLLRTYGVTDAVRAMALRIAQEEYFAQEPALLTVYEREIELMGHIADMENAGVALDEDRLDELEEFYQAIVKKHAGIIAREAKGVNLKSPKQMTAFWFGKRGLKPVRYSTNKRKGNSPVPCQHCRGLGCAICQDTGQNPKCDGEFLEAVGVRHETGPDGEDHLVSGDKLAWAMLHNSAAQSMLQFVQQYRERACREGDELVLHPNYKQVGARTARMSCTDPNLQNVASDESGKKRVDVPYRSREVFAPRKGRIYYAPDYSQIEVWVLAILAWKKGGDRSLLDALAAGGDAHQNVADTVWGHTYDKKKAKRDAKRDPKELTPEELRNLKAYKHARKRAKNLQFCKIYGGGHRKIAAMVGCSEREAKQFVADYDERLPGVKKFMDACVAEAHENGKVVNPFGRVYYIDPGFEYRATNYLVQGTAAEIMKNAMVRVGKLIRANPRWRGKVRVLMQIHDELIIEVDKSVDSPKLRQAIVRAMSADYKVLGSPVPFPVGFKVATERWSLAQDVEVAA